MDLQHGSDESAVLLLYQEAAYADLGTITPELLLPVLRPRASVVIVRVPPRHFMSSLPPAKWSWATAPPRRAA
jgi:hypothetical protein